MVRHGHLSLADPYHDAEWSARLGYVISPLFVDKIFVPGRAEGGDVAFEFSRPTQNKSRFSENNSGLKPMLFTLAD
jgi:hypothetical protein